MKQRTHIIPLGRPEPLHHASMACWCHPTPKEHGEIAIHNAKDGREKWERQGIIERDRPWCLVYEDVEDTFLMADGQPFVKRQTRFA